jgi:predicted negative regulator of RcsB-dependent stress response
MAYDLEEQEQLDELKAWWKQYGSFVTWVVIAALLALAGYKGWQIVQHRQNSQASQLYESLQQMKPTDTKAVRETSAQLIEKYPRTTYAGRAALLAAHANYQTGDRKSAVAQLQWAITHSGEDAVKSIAALQLASVQLEDKQYAAALKTLADKHAAGFDGLVADMKGDVLAAQGKKPEARKAYEEALAKLDGSTPLRQYTAQKLDALGH